MAINILGEPARDAHGRNPLGAGPVDPHFIPKRPAGPAGVPIDHNVDAVRGETGNGKRSIL